MSELKNAGDFSIEAYESLRAEAESLRQRVGQENVNQSSVLASRRLDEALLRLDRAAGRKRDDNRSLTSGKVTVDRGTETTHHDAIHQRLASARTSDLELDESIQQSSAMWFEANDDERTQYRFDEPTSEIRPPASRLRRTTTPSKSAPTPPANPDPTGAPDPTAAFNQPVVAPESPAPNPEATIPSSWATLFASPIDVMISTPSDQAETASAEVAATKTEHVEAQYADAENVETAPIEAAAAPTADVETEIAAMEAQDSQEIHDAPDSVREEADPTIRLEPFQATWRVDEFVIPSTVDELFLGGSVAEQLASRLAAARNDGLRTIAVTSAKPGEGRSTVALGMALSVAFSGLKVAIVDADPRGVRLATDLQLDLDHSWLDTVRDRLPLEEAAVHSDADKLTLIPMLSRDDEPVMDYTDLRILLRKLKTCFDLVVVDCGVAAFAEVGLCDTALIVRDVHRTKALEVETLAMSLRRSGVQGVGVIENFCQG